MVHIWLVSPPPVQLALSQPIQVFHNAIRPGSQQLCFLAVQTAWNTSHQRGLPVCASVCASGCASVCASVLALCAPQQAYITGSGMLGIRESHMPNVRHAVQCHMPMSGVWCSRECQRPISQQRYFHQQSKLHRVRTRTHRYPSTCYSTCTCCHFHRQSPGTVSSIEMVG